MTGAGKRVTSAVGGSAAVVNEIRGFEGVLSWPRPRPRRDPLRSGVRGDWGGRLKAVEVSAEDLIVEVGNQETTNHPP